MSINILRRPLVTEKSTRIREKNGYVIEVDPSASKGQIRSAIESRFKVNVLSIKTTKIVGKFRRRTGPVGGYQPDRKKAIIQVKQGQQINWEEVA
ncbi:MAG: 50S ribosomal protein L23 [Elusimicrobia bacterium]|nr:50S ribosomal protein L23 [Elusimicrobiota bacterium]